MKTVLLISLLSSLAFAGAGGGHSHGPDSGQTTQFIGIVIILALAGGVMWFLSNRKK